jgi:YD repeat-containing protein
MRNLFALFLSALAFLSAEEKTLLLGNYGSVRYLFDEQKLIQIDRLNVEGEKMYSHFYHYGEDGRLLSEDLIGGLGDVIYEGDKVTTPFGEELCKYDENHNLVKRTIDGIVHEYVYDSQNQMVVLNDLPFFKRDENGDTILIADSEYFYDDARSIDQGSYTKAYN